MALPQPAASSRLVARLRLATAGLSGGVVAVAVLGAFGALPVPARPAAGGRAEATPVASGPAALSERPAAAATPPGSTGGHPTASGSDRVRPRDPEEARGPGPTTADLPAPPAHSGSGRRVVFDESSQRVWLVREGGAVARTYPVSGSRFDNLDPGRYEVYSRSRHATSFTGEERMEYMVRFAQGENAAIGFHDIPVTPTGDRIQTPAQLGRPLSAGCIRQRPVDARQLWRFAPLGTKVVVTA